MKKVHLNVGERMQLLRLLPAVGDYTTLRIVREIREELSFSEEEHKKYAIVHQETSDGRSLIKWNERAGLETKEVEISDKVHQMLKARLVDLSRTNKLELTMIRFYEIFVEDIDSGPPVSADAIHITPIN